VVSAETAAVVSAPQIPEVAAAIARTVGPLTAELVPAVAGFRAAGEALGRTAGSRLLSAAGMPQPDPGRVAAVFDSVRLPGRLSLHAVGKSEVLVDSAIDRAGVAAALRAARERWAAGIDHVLLCLPDDKDLDGAIAELGDLQVTFVRLGGTHLRFTRPLPAHWQVVDIDDLALPGLGRHVLALGTVSFTSRILDLMNAQTDRLFTGSWTSHRRGTRG
jgi:dihydrofolate synthase/folylpolyglutamate synthase